jgi:pSer/pThr/pTyr-binding forkhead associated (FHA) protein
MAIRLTVRPLAGHEPTELTFDQQRVRIGRGAGCDFRLPREAVSLEHAMVLLEGSRYYLLDLGSTNGTTLNGEVLVIQRRKLLRSGDVIGIAGLEIEFGAGVPMLSAHSHDRTMTVARRLAHQLLSSEGRGLDRAALVVANGPQEGSRFEIVDPPGTMVIGRAADCDIPLVDGECSCRHAAIDSTAEGIVVRDLGAMNPVLVNGRTVARQRLHDRDEVLVGSTTLVLDDPVEAHLKQLAQLPELGTGSARASSPQREPPRPDTDVASRAVESEPGDAPPPDAANVSDAAKDGPVTSAPAAEPAEALPIADVRRDEPSERRIAPAEPSPGPDEVGQQGPRIPLAEARDSSAGAEIAILLVGALALAACVAALIWIFR